MSDALVLEAHAKINLTLEILGKRHDGYHNLVSVMQTVDLHDTVRLAPAHDISLDCSDPALAGDDNLALRAARALVEVCDPGQGVRITLEKRIPVAAGLGGGSADAAAVLRGLNEMWDAGLSGGEMASLALALGADVPFLLRGGTALVQGRGDDVTPLPSAAMEWIVILSPEIDVADKTAVLFARVTPQQYTRGLLSHKLAGRIRARSDTPAQLFFNAFEQVADEAFPGLADYRSGLESVGAADMVLSGAGPSMFAVPPSREVGVAWQLLLQNRGWRAELVRPWWPDDGTDEG